MIEQIKHALIAGLDSDVKALVEEALAADHDARALLDDGLLAGMKVIGTRFRDHEIFLPDVLLAARAMYAGLDLLEPLIGGDGVGRRGTVVIGTVQGDLHDIGKNLVGIMLRGAGFRVIDLGHGVTPARFVQAAREHDADVVGLSALLTTTMPGMREVVDQLRDAGLGRVKIIIGGAPVTEAFAAEIGADGYGFDGARAVDIVSGWLEQRQVAS